jgi:hypothetical protein
MRRSLAIPVAVLAVTALAAGDARAAEPLDLDLTRLGAPTAAVWQAVVPGLTPDQAATLAGDARVRFARLSSDLALAFSAPLGQPGSTTGYSGFAFGLEATYAQVHHGVIGGAVGGIAPADYWVTREMKPNELFIPALHVRKSLPLSIELGGRFMYLSQSSYTGAQLEAKWAILEGFTLLPDVAVRGAYTMVLGQRDLRLHTTEFDAIVSKRFGVNAVSSLTPYAAARFTTMSASTDVMAFRAEDTTGAPATPAELLASSAAFPTVSGFFFRTTAGVRLTAFATVLNAEVTYYGGGKFKAKDAAPAYSVPRSVTGSFKFGFEF